MYDTERTGRAAGVVAPAVTLAAILVSTLVSSEFSWAGSALSDLGVPGRPTAPLFNGGLLLGGVAALPFAWWLGAAHPAPLRRAGAAALGLATVALAGVGLFPAGEPLHFPTALSFYLLFTLGLLLFGAGDVRRGRARRGLLSLGLALFHLAFWGLWLAEIRIGPGLAVPESVGAVVLAGWMAFLARTAST